MKIALMQLPWNYKPWSSNQLPKLLKQAGDADLVVFPECMPFATTTTDEEAKKELAQAGQVVSDCTFISGGYIREGTERRNRMYLTSGGRVVQSYDKQIRWGERFKEGNKAECFAWGSNKCIPLICADAGDDLTPRKVQMMLSAIEAGAGPKVPIVISSYGGGLMTDYWRPALREWSNGCNAPVIICGISGWHSEQTYEDYMGNKQPFGGGGSGVFWPDGYELQTAVEGVVTIDLKHRTMEHQSFDQR